MSTESSSQSAADAASVVVIEIPTPEHDVKIQLQIQSTQEKNSLLIKQVQDKLQEKQYQATLGIGNIFYAVVGFIFQYQSESLYNLTFPNVLFYSIIVYYTLYSHRVISQYVTIMQVYEEISKKNVLSFSIDLEIGNELEIKKSFQKTLLDRISFNNSFCGILGVAIFITHAIYILYFSNEDSQSILFLAIIFTGYYINVLIYSFLFVISVVKKIFNKMKSTEMKEMLNETITACDSCCICMESFKKRQSLQQYSCCNNIFHTSCILDWKKVSNTCPLCRQNI